MSQIWIRKSPTRGDLRSSSLCRVLHSSTHLRIIAHLNEYAIHSTQFAFFFPILLSEITIVSLRRFNMTFCLSRHLSSRKRSGGKTIVVEPFACCCILRIAGPLTEDFSTTLFFSAILRVCYANNLLMYLYETRLRGPILPLVPSSAPRV